MTNGVHGSLEEVTDSEQVNREIAQIIVEQFGMQSTLTGVAQGAIDRVARIHHDFYMEVIDVGWIHSYGSRLNLIEWLIIILIQITETCPRLHTYFRDVGFGAFETDIK